jgi:hypothetical protein
VEETGVGGYGQNNHLLSLDTDRTEEGASEDHVWFEDQWMVASLCDE